MNNPDKSINIDDVLEEIEVRINRKLPANTDAIEYILEQSGKEKLSEEQGNRFNAMLPAINKKSFWEKIPGINKIYKFIQEKRLEAYKRNINIKKENPIIKKDNSFIESLAPKNYEQDTHNQKTVLEEEIVAVGDLHGKIDKWNLVKQSMNRNPNQKFIILGDAMDKGEYGVEILCEIKELAEQGRVQYIPGNHDVFAYNYVRTKNIDEDIDIFNKAEQLLTRNGGSTTIEKLNNFDQIVNKELQQGRLKNKTSLEDLMNWLGKCKMQQVVNIKDTNYYLAHAIFDTEIYNRKPDFNLEDNYLIEKCKQGDGRIDPIIAGKIDNIVWYRHGELSCAETSLPKGRNDVIIVGHTVQKESVNVKQIEGTPVIYTDCGNRTFEGYSLSKGKTVHLERDRDR